MLRRLTRRLPVIAPLVLLISIVATGAYAAWPTTPGGVPVSFAPPRGDGPPVAVPDSCGGVVCAWLDTIPGSATVDVQRMDFAGNPRWVPNGFPVNPPEPGPFAFDAAPDTSGGVFVAFTDQRIAGNATDVYVQHILSSGAIDPAWPPTGLPVCTLPAIQDQPRVIADGHGGVLIAWLDYRGNVDFAPDIYAQRVDVSAGMLWAANGVPVVQQQRYQGPPMELAADGSGGLYIAWTDDRISTAQQDIYAQHIDGIAGARTWPVAGLGVCTASGIQQDVRVTTSLGNLMLTWLDQRAGQNDLYAQGVTIGGSTMWAPNGVQVNIPLQPQNANPAIVSDVLGGVIIGWTLMSATPTLYAQRLDATGTALWGPGGVVFCNAVALHDELQAVVDQRGGVVFAWEDGRFGFHIWAQRLDSNGTSQWTSNGVLVSGSLSGQRLPAMVPDGAAGAVIAWLNFNSPVFNVYAGQIGAGGALGVRAASKDCAPDICGFAYTDFGDAPENIPAYPSGRPGRFPTCLSSSTPGTQEIACGAALSTPPGPTGYVEHVAWWSDSVYFGFGCNFDKAPGLAVDAELDGANAFGLPSSFPGPSTCSPSVPVNEYEKVFGGMWFGADESAFDKHDSGLLASPDLYTCANPGFPYQAWLCASVPTAVYLNLLVDWNQDGDWNDVVSCPGAGVCAPEWAVKNVPVSLQPGCNFLATPTFLGGPNTGPTWMRMTLTATPVGDDFPWAGTANVAFAAFHSGETEDYPLMIVNRPTAVAGQVIPASLRLQPPAPNPSRGAAAFRFAVPRAGRVELALYDLVGRRVRTLIAGSVAAGAHDAAWDGRDGAGMRVPAGLYYARLRMDGEIQSRCVVIER